MTRTADRMEILTEVLNIGMGRAAASLNQMCGACVEFSIPHVQVLDAAGVADVLRRQAGPTGGKVATVRMQFSGRGTGSAEVMFPADSASQLVSLLIGDADSTEIGGLKACALMEVGNIVLNGVLGSVTNARSEPVTYEVPTYLEATVEQLMCLTSTRETAMALAQTEFVSAESQFLIAPQGLTGRVNLLIGIPSIEVLVDGLDGLLRPAPS